MPYVVISGERRQVMISGDFFKGIILSVTVIAAFILTTNLFSSSSAVAQNGENQIGRYQISSYATYSGARVHFSGYYIVDTTTGKITDQKHETHGISGETSQ
jgi:hypothetical protein